MGKLLYYYLNKNHDSPFVVRGIMGKVIVSLYTLEHY